jgi:hypothetical protein
MRQSVLDNIFALEGGPDHASAIAMQARAQIRRQPGKVVVIQELTPLQPIRNDRRFAAGKGFAVAKIFRQRIFSGGRGVRPLSPHDGATTGKEQRHATPHLRPLHRQAGPDRRK